MSVMKKIAKGVILFSFLFVFPFPVRVFATEATEDIVVPVNVEINTFTTLDSTHARIDYMFMQGGEWKETGFVGDKDGNMLMIQPDPGTTLYIIAYPKDITRWTIDRSYFSTDSFEDSAETSVNYMTVTVPSIGGSFDIDNVSTAYSENEIFLRHSYGGFVGAEVTLGDRTISVEEIRSQTGHTGNESDAVVIDADQTALSYYQIEPSGEISEQAQTIINGTEETKDSRIRDLENQIRILREEKTSLQTAYDLLRGADAPPSRQDALNVRVTELQDRNVLLLNDGAALSLALISKNTTIDELRAENARLRAELEEALNHQREPEEETQPVIQEVPEVSISVPIVEDVPVENILPESDPEMLRPEKFNGVFGGSMVRRIAMGAMVAAIAGLLVFLAVTGRLARILRKADRSYDGLIDRILRTR